jgi:TetR/AcrR family fatty acid metabolism transcriptional regulator
MAKENSTERRREIMRAAIRCFANKGYHGSRISDIAREAGIADGTIYLYFNSKDSLLAELFDDTMDRFIAEGLRHLEGIDDPLEKLSRIIELHLEMLGADRSLAIVFQVELRHNIRFLSRISHRKFQKYLKIIQDCIAEGQEKGLIRRDVAPSEGALILFGALDELATTWVLSDRNYQLRRRAPAVQKVILDGLLAR